MTSFRHGLGQPASSVFDLAVAFFCFDPKSKTCRHTFVPWSLERKRDTRTRISMSILVRRMRLDEAAFLIGVFPRLGLHHGQGDCYGLSRFIRAPFVPGVYLITVSYSYWDRRHLPQQPGGCEAVPRAQTRQVILGYVVSVQASFMALIHSPVFNLCPVSENSYPSSFFDGRVSRYPFPDHQYVPVLSFISVDL
jgi:hypothetical protein